MGYAKSIKLKDFGGNIKKKWHIEIMYFDIATGDYSRIRISDDLNTYQKKSERRDVAKKMILAFKNMIAEGWNPITKEYVEEEKVVLGPDRLNCIWLITHFLNEKEATVNPSTYQSYNIGLSRLKKWLAESGHGNKGVHEIDSSLIRKYLLEMKQERGWTNKTWNSNLQEVSVTFRLRSKLSHSF
jgi:hypothetical protein